MSTPRRSPAETRGPDYIKGDRTERILFYVSMAVLSLALIALIGIAFA